MNKLFTKTINTNIKTIFLLIFLLIAFGSLNVSADTGPKPSVTIFTDINNELYITLLSKEDRSANWHVGKKEYIFEDDEEHKKQVDKFFAYQDVDGYHNLGHYELLDTKLTDYVWSYYPPKDFKVLLYFPSEDKFYVSEKLEQFAFDSYFELKIVDDKIVITKLDDLVKKLSSGDLISKTQIYKNIATTMLITLIVELLIAFLFKYRKRKLVIITIVNIITQVILYLLMYKVLRPFSYYTALGIAEVIVITIEIIVYTKFFDNKKKAFSYAIVANFASLYFGGFVLTML